MRYILLGPLLALNQCLQPQLDTRTGELYPQTWMVQEQTDSTTPKTNPERFNKAVNGHRSQGPSPTRPNRSLREGVETAIQPPAPTVPSNLCEKQLHISSGELYNYQPCVMEPQKIDISIPLRQGLTETSNDVHRRYTQNTDNSPPYRPAQPLPESASPAATSPPSSRPDLHAPLFPQPPYSASAVIVFVIEQLSVNLSTHMENHNSANTTTTTVADSANEFSAHWSV